MDKFRNSFSEVVFWSRWAQNSKTLRPKQEAQAFLGGERNFIRKKEKERKESV